ncbi:hypothetical protein ACWNT8_15710 (plasmid) [Pigmentibacter ruber]
MEKIENHVDESKKRLLKQFQNSKILNAFIETIGERFQELEDELFNLYFLNYLKAEGNKLDDFGDIIGSLRAGLDDEKFKNLLTAAICENNSEGTIEDLIQICRLLTRPKKVLLFEPAPNQVSFAVINPQPLADLKTISKALKSSKLANTELSTFLINLDSPFLFCESNFQETRGFGDESNLGGRFAIELE